MAFSQGDDTMATTADLKRGLIIQIDKAPCLVLEVTSQSPSARGGNTLFKTKYRNLLTGQILEKAFKGGERIDEADFEKRKGQFLYLSAEEGVFMDLTSYEQYEIGADRMAPIQGYLREGMEVQLGFFQGDVVSIELPLVVELEVAETAPVIKHATATAQTKEAVLETGMRLQVPSYLEAGEKVKVDTRDGRFISRV